MQGLMRKPSFLPVQMRQSKLESRLDPDVVLHLPFWNMPDGQTYLSQDAYGHVVTRTGATPTGQGYWGFDAVDDEVSIPHSDSLNIIGSITLIAWVFPNITGDQGILDKDYVNGGYMLWQQGVTNTFDMFINGTRTTGPAIVFSTWNHIVGVADAKSNRVYLNGIEGGSSASLLPTGNTTQVLIGKGAGVRLNGRLASITIVKRGLTDQEICDDFISTRGQRGV